MTNQERLQENNNLIKEIRQLLEDKMLVAAGGTKVIDIELPEKFAKANTIYMYKVNKDIILFSSGASQTGLWRYSVKDDELKQLVTWGYSLQNYYSITDNLVMITSNSSSNPFLVYDIKEDSVTELAVGFMGTINAKKIDGNRFLISSGGSSSRGLYVFDVRTKQLTKVHSAGYDYESFAQMGDYWFVGSGGNGGLLKFNSLTNEVTVLRAENPWLYLNVIDDKLYFSSSGSTAIAGLYVYDNSTGVETTIDDANKSWQSVFKIGNKTYTSNYANTATVQGLYEIENNQLKQVYPDGNDYRYAPMINDRAIITGSASFVLVFDTSNGSFTKINESNAKMLGNFIVLGNKMILTPTSSMSSRLYVYNYDANTLTPYSNFSFYNYDEFKQDGDNCYISSKTPNRPIVYYTNADDSLKVVGYRVEV